MQQLTDSIVIDSDPQQVWDWLTGLADHYTEWHPDHVSARWERGEANRVGSIMRAVEHLGGVREVLRFEVTSFEPPHRFEYRMRGPIALLLPGGVFEVRPHNGGSRFVASISYRFGRFTTRLFRHRVAALSQHMAEEGENLKHILESAAS